MNRTILSDVVVFRIYLSGSKTLFQPISKQQKQQHLNNILGICHTKDAVNKKWAKIKSTLIAKNILVH